MKEDIKPINDKGQPHGLWESYWSDGKLWVRTVYINGNENAIEEFYYYDGKLTCKSYYL